MNTQNSAQGASVGGGARTCNLFFRVQVHVGLVRKEGAAGFHTREPNVSKVKIARHGLLGQRHLAHSLHEGSVPAREVRVALLAALAPRLAANAGLRLRPPSLQGNLFSSTVSLLLVTGKPFYGRT